MARVSKATKKFQSKHLKRTLDHRKQLKLHNKKIKGRRGNKTEEEKRDIAGTKEDQILKKSVKEEVFKDLSVDKLFKSGFSIPKNTVPAPSRNRKDIANDDEVNQVASDLGSDDEELKSYLNNDANDNAGIEDELTTSNGKNKVEKDNSIEISTAHIKKWRNQLSNCSDSKIFESIFQTYSNISNPEYPKLIKFSIEELPKKIVFAVPYQNKRNSRLLKTNVESKNISSSIKPFLTYIISYAFENCENTIDELPKFLTNINILLPYIVTNKKVLKKLLNISIEKLIALVEDQLEEKEDDMEHSDYHLIEVLLEWLKHMINEFKSSILEIFLKLSYSYFINISRKTNSKSINTIEKLKLILHELFITDESIGYQLGFEYLRQLAIHIKSTMDSNNNLGKTTSSNSNSFLMIYNWQFVHALDFWSRVLIKAQTTLNKPKTSPLRQLFKPLIQVSIGVIKLVPTPQFFAIRFHILKILMDLASNTDVYIPLYPYLSEVLFSSLFQKSVSSKITDENNNKLKHFDFQYNIKCSPLYLNSKIYQDSVIEQVLIAFNRYIEIYSRNVVFPELMTPIIISLRGFIDRHDENNNLKNFCSQLNSLINKILTTSEMIQKERAKITFTPDNRLEAARFLNL
ncbi:hypothetical protein TBLA_0E04120 [Henningerozyma blattae CBS 6284]|uniref:Nucleolar complex protein 2 n=1 Tax=Henningerozyma blattae (strain ATCC 34711 / CBS 6284 / DSM 70876 / NBRC 10599 / NRRL Y-10934 / UCD 77-7) TaxID=1071380 RepID=I2H515_HENB6|nr:hypothetical protein TBLA_0E04120 [Tetrapisispora blattae CBS 6284]CCH61467.1 hypothetical protein TBLA_0E04120 [Tetrapisispora blattae CBS 6284]